MPSSPNFLVIETPDQEDGIDNSWSLILTDEESRSTDSSDNQGDEDDLISESDEEKDYLGRGPKKFELPKITLKSTDKSRVGDKRPKEAPSKWSQSAQLSKIFLILFAALGAYRYQSYLASENINNIGNAPLIDSGIPKISPPKVKETTILIETTVTRTVELPKVTVTVVDNKNMIDYIKPSIDHQLAKIRSAVDSMPFKDTIVDKNRESVEFVKESSKVARQHLIKLLIDASASSKILTDKYHKTQSEKLEALNILKSESVRKAAALLSDDKLKSILKDGKSNIVSNGVVLKNHLVDYGNLLQSQLDQVVEKVQNSGYKQRFVRYTEQLKNIDYKERFGELNGLFVAKSTQLRANLGHLAGVAKENGYTLADKVKTYTKNLSFELHLDFSDSHSKNKWNFMDEYVFYKKPKNVGFFEKMSEKSKGFFSK